MMLSTESKLEEVYFFLLERTVRQFRKFSQQELEKRGLTISGEQWVVLKRTHENPGISQREIAESTYKDPASVTRMIDLLEKKNLLSRYADSKDRRSFSIKLTKEGEEFVNKVLPLANDMRTFGLTGISEKELETFVKVLNKIYINIS